VNEEGKGKKEEKEKEKEKEKQEKKRKGKGKRKRDQTCCLQPFVLRDRSSFCVKEQRKLRYIVFCIS